MKKQPKLKGRWASPATAKKWPEGSIVIINRTARGFRANQSVEVSMWFRPDYVEYDKGYGIEPMKFMRLT